jgi:hypothetical protein
VFEVKATQHVLAVNNVDESERYLLDFCSLSSRRLVVPEPWQFSYYVGALPG